MLPRTQFGIRPPTPAGKGSVNTANRYGIEPFYAEVATVAARAIMATGACARTQTLSDARAATQGYLASLGPVVAAVLRGSNEETGLPFNNVWISMLTPRRVGSIRRPAAIRAVALLIPQALLTLCSSTLADRPVPVAQATPQTPVARTVTGETVQGAPVARPGPQEYVSTSVPVARPAPVDATPRFPTLRPRDLPSIPVTSDRQGYTQENTDARAAMAAKLPRKVPQTQLRDIALRAATADALGISGMAVCSDIAFLPGSRDRAIQSVVSRFRSSWTPQMVAVMNGLAVQPTLDGPRWYREMMAQVSGPTDARQILAYVIQQMPNSVVSLCSDIRRQAERE